MLHPSGLQFDVPKTWVDRYSESGNNLHLTGKELDEVGHGAREWDDEYARVCNAVLPFDRCAAHVGGEGWGEAATSYGDLQVRVYDLEVPVKKVEDGIVGHNSDKIGQLIGGSVQIQRSNNDGWHQIIFSYGRIYYDYGETAHVDIRLTQIDAQSVAFVFMYTDYRSQERTIADMLQSLTKKEVGR